MDWDGAEEEDEEEQGLRLTVKRLHHTDSHRMSLILLPEMAIQS